MHPLILTLAVLSNAQAGNFSWLRNGVDALGRSSFEKVSLAPSGRLRWKTAARGADCPGEAGEYKARLEPGAAAELHGIASAVIREQEGKARKGPLSRPGERDPRILLTVFDGGKSRSIEITRLTPAYDLLQKRMGKWKADAVAVSVVKFRAARDGDRIRGIFEHSGPEPFPFVLPANASDAFMIGGAPARYASMPRVLQTVLSPSARTLEVILAAPAGSAAKGPLEVHFSNAIALHHLDPAVSMRDAPAPRRRKHRSRSKAIEQALRYVPEPQEVWICAPVR